ncbi:DUF3987 domain-containing protein [Vibrio cyclitrophicus]|uniref:DUF3987 domain-containing protein n=1 Tax=Vibrio cyclitrophicus TaxID=47951 RepID=UPI000C838C54|nr:DUF3987 domain-containing protein [Vibrio cyclitrophicus]PME78014.1 hypothetical protein BCV29_11020 [Vibrio cyclitrophicus]
MRLLSFFKKSDGKFIPKVEERLLDYDEVNWNDVIPIETIGSEHVENVSNEMLPESLYQYASKNAYAINQSSMDYVVVALITSAASLIGGSASITPKKFDKKWKIKPTIWALGIGDVSGMKTPLLMLGLKPLELVQKNILDILNIKNSHQQKIEHALIDEKQHELEDKAKVAFSNGDDELGKAIIEELSELKKIYFAEREVICNDLTPEALILKLRKNPLGVLIFNDEMSNLFSNFNKQGREQLRPLLLEGFNATGSKYVQERKTSEKIVVDSVHVNMLGGIQPDLLEPLVRERENGKGNDGFIERFQLAVFPDASEARYVDTNVDAQVDEKVFKTFEKIAELGVKDALNFSFSGEAQNEWDKWQKRFQANLNEQHKEYRAILVKLPAMVAKLALIFHIYAEAERSLDLDFHPNQSVSVDSFKMALRWVGYLNSHSRKILGLNRLKVDDSVQSLLERLPLLKGEFTKQKLGQKDWKNLTTARDRNRAIETLEQYGYIKLVLKPKKMYLVHPEFCQKK